MNNRRLVRLARGLSITHEPHGHWGVHPSRRVFTIGSDDTPIRYRGHSFFRGLDRWVRGEDIRPVLRAFDGFNVSRVWPYVPWDTNGWDAPPNGKIVDFVRFLGDMGRTVELTLLTDHNPRRLPWALSLIEALAEAQLWNLVLEAGNEPGVEVNGIAVEVLYTALRNSGYLWSSGHYGQDAQERNLIKGLYGCAHTARTDDWARRGHDLWEYWNGAGPDLAWSGLKVPWVGDEPKRPDQSAPQIMWQGKVLTTKLRDYRAYGGLISLLGAGGTFHSECGKQATLPSEDERLCAREMLRGLTAFPPDAPLGAYNGTLREEGAHPDARTYPVGVYMVRVWQTGPVPEGWRAMDEDGVLCRKV